jgi:hypothetical protein
MNVVQMVVTSRPDYRLDRVRRACHTRDSFLAGAMPQARGLLAVRNFCRASCRMTWRQVQAFVPAQIAVADGRFAEAVRISHSSHIEAGYGVVSMRRISVVHSTGRRSVCSLAATSPLFLGLLILSGCSGGGGSSGSTVAPVAKITIQPMTTVVQGAAPTGYFSDPYPIHTLAQTGASTVPSFSGTTKALLNCPGTVQPDCFTATADSIDPGPFAQQATAVGSSIKGYENLNMFQDSTGTWQMAVTALMNRPTATGTVTWSVIMHAYPTGTAAGVPTAWVADTLLVGSLDTPAAANYDGKYFEDGGVLYLVYSMKLATNQDGIVAQAMQSATQPASSQPVPLLGPETADGGYNSELFEGLNQSNPLKLLETGNISVVQGKYVMAYSTGRYDESDYKAGLAWSDTFLPPTGSYYKRPQKIDTAGVWGQPNHAEVPYLLQSQEPEWPNYVADQVLAPGVPSVVSDTGGNYFLFFAGYAPSDAPILSSTGGYDGTHRRPFFINLQVAIPSGSTVAAATPEQLATWIQPATSP